MDRLSHLFLIARVAAALRSLDLATCFDALLLARRKIARVDGRINRWAYNAQIERDVARPLARAFLPGDIEHEVNQRSVRLTVLNAKDFRGYLDEEGFE